MDIWLLFLCADVDDNDHGRNWCTLQPTRAFGCCVSGGHCTAIQMCGTCILNCVCTTANYYAQTLGRNGIWPIQLFPRNNVRQRTRTWNPYNNQHTPHTAKHIGRHAINYKLRKCIWLCGTVFKLIVCECIIKRCPHPIISKCNNIVSYEYGMDVPIIT